MSGPRRIRNLVLAGFMGTGKSSVGRCAAMQLRFHFVDTDDLIEAQAGKSISEIFAQDGEPAFRAWERQVVAGLDGAEKMVIATGGGLVVEPDNLARLKEHALVVCLWASPETIWERVRHRGHRPLLNEPDAPASIRRLLAEREPHYRQADVLVSTEQRAVREVAATVLHEFHCALRQG
jgi:shikimate kinase